MRHRHKKDQSVFRVTVTIGSRHIKVPFLEGASLETIFEVIKTFTDLVSVLFFGGFKISGLNYLLSYPIFWDRAILFFAKSRRHCFFDFNFFFELNSKSGQFLTSCVV